MQAGPSTIFTPSAEHHLGLGHQGPGAISVSQDSITASRAPA